MGSGKIRTQSMTHIRYAYHLILVHQIKNAGLKANKRRKINPDSCPYFFDINLLKKIAVAENKIAEKILTFCQDPTNLNIIALDMYEPGGWVSYI